MKKKVLLGLASLALSLLLLEIGLRTAGYYYLSKTVKPVSEIDFSPGATRILCVGDSFTYGGRVARDETYPALLDDLVHARVENGTFNIINQGVCEYNARQLLGFLPLWIETYRPHIVVLLVGSANKFNPWGYTTSRSTSSRVTDFLKSLRVVKMLRIIGVELEARFLASSGRSGQAEGGNRHLGIDGRLQNPGRYQLADEYIRKMYATPPGQNAGPLAAAWQHFINGRHETAIEQCEKLLQFQPRSTEALCALGHFHQETGDLEAAERYFRQAYEADPASELVVSQVAFFYSTTGRELLAEGRFAESIEYFTRAIEFNPDDEYLYYAICKAYELQSTYDADIIVKKCRDLLAAAPELADNPKFMNHIWMFENKQAYDREMKTLLKQDLDEIIRLSRESGADVIVQNYPVSYPLANNALKDAADKYDLPLVENLPVFTKLVDEGKQDVYFFDDDHCTPAGHAVMAENVFRVLQGEGVFPE